MKLENMKNEFPVMPEEIRDMVEREVEKQLKTAVIDSVPKRKGLMRGSLIAALAAAMVLGTTVFAEAVYHMGSESVGNYGAAVKTEEAAAGQTESGSEAGQQTIELLPVTMEVSYLPEGMIEVDDSGKYCYEDNLYKGGVTIGLYGMDTGDSQFEMSFEEVVSREDITINGYDAVYLEFSKLYEDEISFNQRIYVAYPDIHYVMEMFVASDVAKEEALKIAEGIRLTPAPDGEGEKCISEYKWSEYLASETETSMEIIPNMTVDENELKNTHAIGESFSVAATIPWDGYEGLTAKVSEVQVLDNINILDLSGNSDIREELAKETDAEGNLLPCEINYVKYGNGTDTLSEVVGTKEVPQKLVYVTLEYTNNGEAEMTDILYMCGLIKLVEKDGQIEVYSGEKPGENDDWDEAQVNGAAHFVEMYYMDVFGKEEHKNYIDSLQPGETATVHVAWVVPEQDLGYMYLNLCGNPYEILEEELAIGYVDIRR